MIREPFLWPLIERRAEATPAALFAIDESEHELSFAGYRDRALRVAAGLQDLGIGPGTVVSWQLPTRIDTMVLCGALARLGALQNPILPILREREVGFITRQLDSRHLFVPGVFRNFDFAAMARELAGADLAVHVADAGLPEADPGRLPPAPVAVDPDEAPVRWVLYSSGTTADPKGARHADPSVCLPGLAMCDVLALGPEDRNALVFPFTHIGGIGWLVAGLAAGFAQLVVEVFEPARTIPFLREHGVTTAGAGTVFHQAYLAAQQAHGKDPLFPAIRSYPGGGAPKPPSLFAELQAATGAPIVSGYGLTEHPIAVMGTVRDPDDRLARTEGRATRGTEIRIVGHDGARCGPGLEGEVRVRGPHLFRGYVDGELDREAFDALGFLRTGDLGSLDAEGYLAITGRTKDVIIRKGENISAKEIEDHLYEHAKIRDVAVIGLPDPATGERACAVVVLKAPDDEVAFDELGPYLRGRGLAPQKIPEQLEIVAELPRNPSGKVLKRELQQRFTTT